MKLGITGDCNKESGVADVVFRIAGAMRAAFKGKNYGVSCNGFFIILMCRDPELNFKRRIRFDKEDREISLDIMLDFEEMKLLDFEGRKAAIMKRIPGEILEVFNKYKKKQKLDDFDIDAFLKDLREWFSHQ